ncbi:MAG: hypothetical protein EVA56_01785 [alpha proteobacterium HIMB114]|nr:MAG: hypothetical protein EVA56_01785 [alpha proteobacterium HIMB114]|tara:strand:- start:5245 stop:5868 length:624 start_codon:yes stop_codon:yes gene_type:complete
MKKNILDLGEDVTLQEIIKLKKIKIQETVNFIDDLIDYESLLIANLSSASKSILLTGFDSLKIPLICLMNSSERSKVNFLTKSEKILKLSYQYNDQNNQISLREEMSNEDTYFDEINSNDIYKDKLDIDNLNENKILNYLKLGCDLTIIYVDSNEHIALITDLVQKQNVEKSIYLVKTNLDSSIFQTKTVSFNKIQNTNLYFIKKIA